MAPFPDVLSLIRVLMIKAVSRRVLLWCHRDVSLCDVLLPLTSQCARVNEIVFFPCNTCYSPFELLVVRLSC